MYCQLLGSLSEHDTRPSTGGHLQIVTPLSTGKCEQPHTGIKQIADLVAHSIPRRRITSIITDRLTTLLVQHISRKKRLHRGLCRWNSEKRVTRLSDFQQQGAGALGARARGNACSPQAASTSICLAPREPWGVCRWVLESTTPRLRDPEVHGFQTTVLAS